MDGEEKTFALKSHVELVKPRNKNPWSASYSARSFCQLSSCSHTKKNMFTKSIQRIQKPVIDTICIR